MVSVTVCPIASTPIVQPPPARLDNTTTQVQPPALPHVPQAPTRTSSPIPANHVSRRAVNVSTPLPIAWGVSPVVI